jgi:hypothetical protein
MFDLKENGQTGWTHFAQGKCYCEHDTKPSGLKKKKREVSQLAEGVCSTELNNTILMPLVTAVDMAALNFQEPNSYVHIKIYEF